MIFSKRTIPITSIPKIRQIHGGIWKLKAKNLQNCQFWSQMAKFWPSQNFPGIYTMIFSKKTARLVSVKSTEKLIKNRSYRINLIFWPTKTLKAKIWPFFGQNWQFWEFLTYNFQTPLWIFLIFGMEVVLMVLFEKIILYMPGKFWYGEFLPME